MSTHLVVNCSLVLWWYACPVSTRVRRPQYVQSPFCIPVLRLRFAGGNLLVKHRHQTVDFSWAEKSTTHVQWAAFYGDCEHEVLEVTKGNRITLTYNLYRQELVTATSPATDVRCLPLFQSVKSMLSETTFMKHGRFPQPLLFVQADQTHRWNPRILLSPCLCSCDR